MLQANSNAIEHFFSSVIKLRELELRELWRRAEALIRFLIFRGLMDVEEEDADRPTSYPEFERPYIAIGIARWEFNALSHRLPKAQPNHTAQEPPKEDKYYWDHIEFLAQHSKELTAKARAIKSGGAVTEVFHGYQTAQRDASA